MAPPTLVAEGVTHVYGKTVAIEDLNLEVADGEFLVIVGASGCGKSTLLKLVAGFEQPTSGRVLLRGKPVETIEPRCGMVFQNYALFPWLSVADNISFGPRLRGVDDKQAIDDLMKTVGIAGFSEHYPSQLSGGMRQRVALARTLANDPEVLLCDEPFAAVDAMTRQLLQEELSRIAAHANKTVVFITHSIEEAILLADRIVVLTARPGRVKRELINELERPRTNDMLMTAYARELKREIWGSVRDEVAETITAT